MQQGATDGIAKGDVLQRIAGPSFIVGAILLVAGNILHPRSDTDLELMQDIAADMGGLWEAYHLMLVVGMWALLIGVVGIYRSISTGGGATWARLSFYGLLVGITLWTVLFATDGLGLPLVVESWEDATGSDKRTLFLIANALGDFNFGLFTIAILANWLAFTFLGVGMVLSTVYPKVYGWTILVLGVATVGAVGIPQGFTGETDTTQILFAVLSLLSTVWVLMVGLWVTRRAW